MNSSTIILAISILTIINHAVGFPSHFRSGHPLALKHQLVSRHTIAHQPEINLLSRDVDLTKRSSRPFGEVKLERELEVRSNETDDEEDCDDGDEDDQEQASSKPDNTNSKSTNTTSTTNNDWKPSSQSNTATQSTSSSTESKPASSTTSTKPASVVAKKVDAQVSASAGISVSVSTSSSDSNSGGDATTYSGKATFFDQGGVAGSCGTVHQDSDYVVAIDSSMYDNGAFCGKKIAITRVSTGKTIYATGADECPGCPTSQSLDLSTGAFNALGSPDEGVFAITWKVV